MLLPFILHLTVHMTEQGCVFLSDKCRSFLYFMLSTQRKRRFQRMPLKPWRSGSLDHQMKMGLPTMWSSGTKPH